MGLEALDVGPPERQAAPTLEHAGFLEDLTETPGCLVPGHPTDFTPQFLSEQRSS